MRRRWPRILAGLLLVAVAAAAIAPIRRAALVGIGRHLTASDAPADADLLAMDMESGFAGAIKLGDLYREHAAPTVAMLVPNKTAIEEALKDRRVVLPNVMVDVLLQLGIPRHAIAQIPAGEGGTTDSTGALAGWSRANPSGRVLVVVSPSHGRRYRRALLRAWPAIRRRALSSRSTRCFAAMTGGSRGRRRAKGSSRSRSWDRTTCYIRGSGPLCPCRYLAAATA